VPEELAGHRGPILDEPPRALLGGPEDLGHGEPLDDQDGQLRDQRVAGLADVLAERGVDHPVQIATRSSFGLAQGLPQVLVGACGGPQLQFGPEGRSGQRLVQRDDRPEDLIGLVRQPDERLADRVLVPDDEVRDERRARVGKWCSNAPRLTPASRWTALPERAA
jgi:hypothetical protein